MTTARLNCSHVVSTFIYIWKWWDSVPIVPRSRIIRNQMRGVEQRPEGAPQQPADNSLFHVNEQRLKQQTAISTFMVAAIQGGMVLLTRAFSWDFPELERLSEKKDCIESSNLPVLKQKCKNGCYDTLFAVACSRSARSQKRCPIWFPHCPTKTSVQKYKKTNLGQKSIESFYVQYVYPGAVGMSFHEEQLTRTKQKVRMYES